MAVVGFALLLNIIPLTSVVNPMFSRYFNDGSIDNILYLFVFLFSGCIVCSAASWRPVRWLSRIMGTRRVLLVLAFGITLLYLLNVLATVACWAMWARRALSALCGFMMLLYVVLCFALLAAWLSRQEMRSVFFRAFGVAALVGASICLTSALGFGMVAVSALFIGAPALSGFLLLGFMRSRGFERDPAPADSRQQASSSCPALMGLLSKRVWLLLIGCGFASGSAFSLLANYGNGIAELSVATGIAQALTFLVLLALSRASGVKTVALGWFWRGSLFIVVVGFALIDSFGPTVDALSAVMLSIGYPLLGFGVFLTTVETSLLRKCELAQAWTPVALAFGIGCFPAMVLGGVFESRVVCATGIVAVALTMLFLPVSGEDAANLPAVRLGSPDMSEYIGRRTQDLVARHALTAREGDVLGCLVSGLTYREIAGELGISEQTVKVHVRNLYAKCGVHSRGALMELLLSR